MQDGTTSPVLLGLEEIAQTWGMDAKTCPCYQGVGEQLGALGWGLLARTAGKFGEEVEAGQDQHELTPP